jgi:hypothetical protein
MEKQKISSLYGSSKYGMNSASTDTKDFRMAKALVVDYLPDCDDFSTPDFDFKLTKWTPSLSLRIYGSCDLLNYLDIETLARDYKYIFYITPDFAIIRHPHITEWSENFSAGAELVAIDEIHIEEAAPLYFTVKDSFGQLLFENSLRIFIESLELKANFAAKKAKIDIFHCETLQDAKYVLERDNVVQVRRFYIKSIDKALTPEEVILHSL